MTPTIALIGNPNVGKTTLFNALTGLKHTTGNYAGVTVERKAGAIRCNGMTGELVDLPGTYSLAAQSPDEMIVFDVLLGQQKGEKPVDAILAVVDATNIDRNLYLVSQVRELGLPLVVAMNMMDIAERRSIQVDAAALSRALGVPVVPICAHNGKGLDHLRTALAEAVKNHPHPPAEGPAFPAELVEQAHGLAETLSANGQPMGRAVPWQEAFRILVDRGGYAEKRLTLKAGAEWDGKLAGLRQSAGNGSLAAVETRARYAWIRSVVAQGVKKPSTPVLTRSDRIDQVLTHKVWGSLVFVLIMLVVFQSIYTWAGPIMDLIDGTFGSIGAWVGAQLPEGPLQSLVQDGIIAGVGAVVIFLPQILILFLFIALLEDCGYMARAAFLMDKLLSKVGLSGQSFIPLLSSFACAIPGVMATRTIPGTKDRLATMLVAPLMSCSARLPVYTIMIGAFIPAQPILGNVLTLKGVTLFAMYFVGVAVAIPVTWAIKKLLLKGETPPFLMELPSYKWPQAKTVYRKVSHQGWMFLRRAGTLIFAITVVVWALAYFPRSADITAEFDRQREAAVATVSDEAAQAELLTELDGLEDSAHLRNSIFGRIGHVIEPVFVPLGWDWRIAMATVASFPAREVVVATMSTIFALSGDLPPADDLDPALAEDPEFAETALRMRAATWPDGRPLFTIPVALSVMVFFALCCQCGATLAVMRRESGSWKWPVFAFVYMTALAYVAAFAVYQAGTAVGLG